MKFEHHPWAVLDKWNHTWAKKLLPKRVRHFICNRFDTWVMGDLDDWGDAE